MKLQKFDQANTFYPAEQATMSGDFYAYKGQDGQVVMLWRLSFLDRVRLLFRGKLWVRVLTFNQPLQIHVVTADSPFEKDGD